MEGTVAKKLTIFARRSSRWTIALIMMIMIMIVIIMMMMKMLTGDPRGRDDYVTEHHGDTEDNCLIMNDRSMQALDGILFIAEHKKKDEESTKVMMIAIIIIIIIIVIVIIIFIILNCHHDHNCRDPQTQNHEDLKNVAALIDPLCSSVNH